MKKYRLPSEANYVPKDQSGVYWFGLALPRAHEIGLSKGMGASERDSSCRQIANTLDRFSKVYSQAEIKGVMSDIRQKHLGNRYSVNASQYRDVYPSEFLAASLSRHKNAELISFYSSLLVMASSLPPVYIGLAYQNSLYERLQDHIDGRSNLKARMDDASVVWQDLYYVCKPILNLEKNDFRNLEKTLQALYSPVFSVA